MSDPEENGGEVRKVLVADDNEAEREAFAEILRGRQLAVVQVGSGREAIKFLENESFHIVFIDIIMPGMHGLDLLKRVQDDFPGLPIIVCAGDREVSLAEKAVSMGALDYLVKPVAAPEVHRVLRWINNLKCRMPSSEEHSLPEPTDGTPEKETIEFHREMFRILGGKTEPVRIYHEIAEGIHRSLPCRAVEVFLENESGELELVAGWGKDGEIRSEVALPSGRGLIGWAKDKCEGLLVNNPHDDSRFDPEVDGRDGLAWENVLLAPITVHEKGLGVIAAVNCTREGGFTPQDLEFIEGVAPAMGIAMRIEWLHRNLESRIDDLAQTESQIERLKGAFLKSEKERRAALKELKKAK